MNMRTTPILPMLSLVVLASLAAAGAVEVIRLPGDVDGKGDVHILTDADAAAETNLQVEGQRPSCCDNSICRSIQTSTPLICHCLDKVEQCAASCKLCHQMTSSVVCLDWYPGPAAPRCTTYLPRPAGDAMTAAAAAATTTNPSAGETPWTCCDKVLIIGVQSKIGGNTVYQCVDKVEECASACQKCEAAPSGRYICKDYSSSRGPRCTEATNEGVLLVTGSP